MTKRPEDYSDYQRHPRYGKKPRVTGLNPSEEQLTGKVQLHWHSGKRTRILDTAIVANIHKQAPATIHVTHYFDSKRVCRRCGVHFIFFAEEQRYWYEELKFPLEVDMVECINCRKHEQMLQRAKQEYEALMAIKARAEPETLRMLEIGLLLVEEGIFSYKVLPKFRGLLNALKNTPAHKVSAIKQSIHKLAEQGDSKPKAQL